VVPPAKYDGKFASFGKEVPWTKFNAVERVSWRFNLGFRNSVL